MRKDRRFLYMSEVDVGFVIPPSGMSIIRSKVDSRYLTEIVLGGRKYFAPMAFKAGLVDVVHDNSTETLEVAIDAMVKMGQEKWNKEVYLQLRLSFLRIYGETVASFQRGFKFVQLVTALMDLKLPSIVAMSRHASAGGFIFTLAHDYRFMRKDRGFLRGRHGFNHSSQQHVHHQEQGFHPVIPLARNFHTHI